MSNPATAGEELIPLVNEPATDQLEANSLLSQLRVIEDQPLDTRAAALVHVHDRLQRRLEGADSSPSYG